MISEVGRELHCCRLTTACQLNTKYFGETRKIGKVYLPLARCVSLFEFTQEAENGFSLSSRRNDGESNGIRYSSELVFAVGAVAQQAPHRVDIEVSRVSRSETKFWLGVNCVPWQAVRSRGLDHWATPLKPEMGINSNSALIPSPMSKARKRSRGSVPATNLIQPSSMALAARL
jgi:hypothetical protein